MVAAGAGPAVRTVVVDATERSIIEDTVRAAELGIIDPTFVGPADLVRAAGRGVPGAEDVRVIDAADEEAAADRAVAAVTSGAAQMLCKGHIHTDALLHPVLRQLRTSRRMSHVFVVGVDSYPKLLGITDASINIAPDVHEKAAIIRNAVELFQLLGIPAPRVAVLSAIETINAGIPSTVDAGQLVEMSRRDAFPGAIVDGPLAFDDAISSTAASTKGIRSTVAGSMDIALVADLVSGNILVKALEYLAGATVAGLVLGAQVPIVLTSRSDPSRSRLASFALAAVVHHRTSTGAPPSAS